ncbi:MAG: hypothetical protein IK101_05340 [Oscillospiraceae bacterium]|nr:hypothetical protein [Oscillospiraceae bacterium]
MSEDTVQSVIRECFISIINQKKKEGLSEEEIEKKLSQDRINEAVKELIATMSTDSVNYLKSNMYEIVIDERARAEEFIARNEQIWAKGFVASEAMYLIVLDCAKEYNSFVRKNAQDRLADYQYRFYALTYLHGRALQQYLEIVYLLKAGFADGAYARWRSIYEISVISQFIGEQESEELAKSYIDSANTDSHNYKWAKKAPCFSNSRKKNITFKDIQDKCNEESGWIELYRLSSKLVHASAQGTFGRFGQPSQDENLIPVGHSDFGLALPAENAAISLALTSVVYFGLIPYGESDVFMLIILKWVDYILECYHTIKTESFSDDLSEN